MTILPFSVAFQELILNQYLTQPPCLTHTLTGWGNQMHPNIGTTGCTLPVGAAGHILVETKEVCSGFTLASSPIPFWPAPPATRPYPCRTWMAPHSHCAVVTVWRCLPRPGLPPPGWRQSRAPWQCARTCPASHSDEYDDTI